MYVETNIEEIKDKIMDKYIYKPYIITIMIEDIMREYNMDEYYQIKKRK